MKVTLKGVPVPDEVYSLLKPTLCFDSGGQAIALISYNSAVNLPDGLAQFLLMIKALILAHNLDIHT